MPAPLHPVGPVGCQAWGWVHFTPQQTLHCPLVCPLSQGPRVQPPPYTSLRGAPMVLPERRGHPHADRYVRPPQCQQEPQRAWHSQRHQQGTTGNPMGPPCTWGCLHTPSSPPCWHIQPAEEGWAGDIPVPLPPRAGGHNPSPKPNGPALPLPAHSRLLQRQVPAGSFPPASASVPGGRGAAEPPGGSAEPRGSQEPGGRRGGPCCQPHEWRLCAQGGGHAEGPFARGGPALGAR